MFPNLLAGPSEHPKHPVQIFKKSITNIRYTHKCYEELRLTFPTVVTMKTLIQTTPHLFKGRNSLLALYRSQKKKKS